MTDSKSLIHEFDVMLTPTSPTQLETLLKRHRSNRTGLLDRDTPFLWHRFLLSLFSYALLLTDVLHTVVGIHKNNAFPALQPSEILIFGSFSDSVQHIEQNETAVLKPQDIWMYKFDSTSIAIRAYAEFFQLEALLPCLRYQEACILVVLTSSTIFELLDSLVETMARHKIRAPARSGLPTSVTLQTTSRWIDRAHDFILPGFFGFPLIHTNQALYYTDAFLSSTNFQFCGANRVRPYTCADSWTHFARLCPSSRSRCKDIGRIWEHMIKREQLLRRQYSDNVSLDMLILEDHEGYSKPALSFHGQKIFDVVVITWIHNCTVSPPSEPQNSSQHPPTCTTIAVDDCRYEGVSASASVTDWYKIVALLRCIGQSYMWLRVALLFLGCFYARPAEPRYQEARLHTRIAVAIRTVFFIPSHVAVYGRIFPISCYVLAHLIDSAMVYELVSQQFTTALGVFHLNFHDFVGVSAVLYAQRVGHRTCAACTAVRAHATQLVACDERRPRGP